MIVGANLNLGSDTWSGTLGLTDARFEELRDCVRAYVKEAQESFETFAHITALAQGVENANEIRKAHVLRSMLYDKLITDYGRYTAAEYIIMVREIGSFCETAAEMEQPPTEMLIKAILSKLKGARDE